MVRKPENDLKIFCATAIGNDLFFRQISHSFEFQAIRAPSIVFYFFSFFDHISKTDRGVKMQLGVFIVKMEGHSNDLNSTHQQVPFGDLQ